MSPSMLEIVEQIGGLIVKVRVWGMVSIHNQGLDNTQ